jgi:hypothetical protein
MMNTKDSADLTQAQIDRLVAGELLEAERRNLLVWLDEDVRRWRLCAMAFLEAQSWEAAAAGLAPAATAKGNQALMQNTPACTRVANCRQSWAVWQALAIAASLALAFAVGLRSASVWQHAQPVMLPGTAEASGERVPGNLLPDSKATSNVKQPLMATVAVRTNLDPGVTAQLQLPVRPLDGGEAHATSISEYDRKQWERQGFELIEERRYLPARLPDGRQVVVPVNKVHVKVKRTPVS